MTDSYLQTIGDLVRGKIIAEPMDGNHGETHPKGNDFTTSGIPFVMASDICNGEIDFGKCKYISKDQSDGLRKGFALPGDVLLSHKATIGRTAIVPASEFPYLMLTPQVTYYRVLDKGVLDNKFLKYYFDSPWFQKALGLWAGAGSTRAYLGITEQKNLPITIPDIKIQKGIVDVLSVVDEKIKLNNQINCELEAMAKLIYDYWFVQFDFPDENGKPYKSSGGKMVYSEELQKEIPLGWCTGSLLDIATFTNGVACQKFPTIKGEDFYKVIKIKEMGSGFSEKSDLVSKGIPDDRVVNRGDVLFSWSATLLVKIWHGEVGGLNQHIFKVTSETYPRSFYFHALLRYLDHFKMMAEMRKTTMGHITQEHLEQSIVVKPPLPLVNRFHEQINPLIEATTIKSNESENLASLRDWLLPMLMNGQVTVGEAS